MLNTVISTDHIQLASYNISMRFRTENSDGVILFAKSTQVNLNKRDFIGIFIQDGHIKHSFDNYLGATTSASSGKYNNGLWHTLLAEKDNDIGKICVDGACDLQIGAGKDANLNPEYYLGGVPDGLIKKAQKYLVSF